MNNNLEKITKTIPIVYPIIIFIGYYNYLSYYRYFDIEIFPYLSIYEILFSIVSQLIPVFIIGFLLLCYLVFLIILPFAGKDEKKKKKQEKEEDRYLSGFAKRYRKINKKEDINISLIYNNFHIDAVSRWYWTKRKLKNKKYGRAISHLFLLFWDIIGVVIKLSLWFFFFSFTLIGMTLMFSPLKNDLDYYYPFFTSQTSIIISILVWCAITYALISRISKDKPKSSLSFMRILPLIFLMFLSITIFQKIEAEKTTKHLSKDVRFEYNGEKIVSSRIIVFVGKTADYIFLRDLKNKENYIYPVSDVKNLIISEIKE